MYYVYSKDELVKELKNTEKHLEETRDDIIGYCSELHYTIIREDKNYSQFCKDWLTILNNTYHYLIKEYNHFNNLILLLS